MTTRTTATKEAASYVNELTKRLIQNIELVIIGKRQVITSALIAFLCEGHVLLEDVPGTAKTVLAKSIARSIGCVFQRVQCTPDLLPSDVTGVSVFNQKCGEFEFRPGPVFANILLADELNRATPRTQSALLEAMAEGQITTDTCTRRLARPFMVFATQNPIEYEGTFPLPEAQLDRFCMRLKMGYPDENTEVSMLERLRVAHPVDSLQPVASVDDIIRAQEYVKQIYVHEEVRNYIVKLVRATRGHAEIAVGASPRASIALFRAAQAAAAVRGWDYVLPDFVKLLVQPTLEHRIMLKPETRLNKRTAMDILWEIQAQVSAPNLKDKACTT
ncbi:MAG: ATPase family associated with various cellular activities (AAA) [bacterium ADurb.Bin429]|nr:MAG: ATPase family associated with various cellular activities (AAA) [bacterium ADurb.Bin429]